MFKRFKCFMEDKIVAQVTFNPVCIMFTTTEFQYEGIISQNISPHEDKEISDSNT